MKYIVSVIIPYYNNSTTLIRALESVVNQDFNNFEVIIINDYSNDWINVVSEVNSLDNRISIIHHEKNKNGAVARNTGILASKGEYIAFLDADDEWKPSHLSTLLNLIKTENSDVVYSSCTVLSKNNFQYTVPNKSIKLSNNLGEYLFSDDGFIQTSCLLVRSQIAKKVLFNISLIRHQDYDFLLRLEEFKVKFSWSKSSTVLVHWENNDINKKGGTWQFSLKWYHDYKRFLSSKAQTYFVLKFIIYRILNEREVVKGVRYFLIYCKPWHLSLKEYYFMVSYLIFGEVRLPLIRFKK